MHREDLRERPRHHILVERAPEGAPRGPMVKRSMTHARPKSRIDDFDPSAPKPPPLPAPIAYDGVEIAARTRGRLVDIAVLRRSSDQYILGHRTPQGAVAPGKAHLGLRLLRINDDRTVDLVFPLEAGGHLVRGAATVMFSELTEGLEVDVRARDVRPLSKPLHHGGRRLGFVVARGGGAADDVRDRSLGPVDGHQAEVVRTGALEVQVRGLARDDAERERGEGNGGHDDHRTLFVLRGAHGALLGLRHRQTAVFGAREGQPATPAVADGGP